MSKHLQRDLEKLHSQLLALFGVIEQMIDQAARALCERQTDLVETVLLTDRQVNEADVQIEEDCLKILALHQPVAADLRRISTVLKVNADLERIGDLAKNIAERAKSLGDYPYFPIPEQLSEMVRQAVMMVRMAIDAFVNSDTALAKKVIQYDTAVDTNNRLIIGELKELMKTDSGLVEPALHCFSASRHIERIADHAENIAEEVVYLVDGDIVRHKHGNFSLGKHATQDAEVKDSRDRR
ncbi:MAG: phosphate signaling complex protein PhoU [Planctomycetota bacterium]|jgi:phosphate transport system protein